MSTWRTLVVAMVVCSGLWLIGCHEETKPQRNATVDDANITVAQMHAEQVATAAREAAKPTATGGTTPAVPTTNPATTTTPPAATPAPVATPPASAPG